MWAKGSPGPASPSKVRKIGRTGSDVRESVITIRLIGWASGSIWSQRPRAVSMRAAPAAIAEARASFFHTPSGAASTTMTERCGAAFLIETATESPT